MKLLIRLNVAFERMRKSLDKAMKMIGGPGVARDIFISYSQPDRDCAYEVTQQLEANGFSVWIAPRDVSPAADFVELERRLAAELDSPEDRRRFLQARP